MLKSPSPEHSTGPRSGRTARLPRIGAGWRALPALALILTLAACASASPPAGAPEVAGSPADTTRVAAAPRDSVVIPARMPPAPPPALFVDLDRNLARLNSPAAIAALVDTAAGAGIRRIIVDVKKRDGSVVFKSRVAPSAGLDFDYFGAFREAGRRHAVEIVAAFQVLVEGDVRTRTGPAFDRPEWQQVVEVENRGLLPQSQIPQAGSALLASPVLVSVQRYEATVFSDLLQQLKPDGVYLDELRYFSREADLGDSAHAAFDTWHGLSPTVDWPKPVLDRNDPRFAKWVTFRATVIYELYMRLKKLRDTLTPETPLLIGGPGYFEPSLGIGVNWAHSSFRASIWYYTEAMRQRALADQADQLLLICNETNPAAVKEVLRGVDLVTARQRPVSMFYSVERFQRRPGRLLEALTTTREAGFGIVIGDGGQIGAGGFWETLREALRAS